MLNVAVIAGEDAAPEAVGATIRVLKSMQLDISFTFPPVGEEGERRHGSTFPDEARTLIDDADTTLFGATSGPSGIALFYLRFGMETFANVRPAKWLTGMRSPLSDPTNVDILVVRENLEGLYCGLEGPLSDLASLNLRHPLGGRLDDRDGHFAIKVVTEQATRRIAGFAADRAIQRRAVGHRGLVTIGAKHNILAADSLFVEVCTEVLDQRGVEHESNHIDNLARRMVAEPASLDVVLVPNLYGDILSDLAAGVIGGLGLMPSGCYGDTYAYFEPPHGTAPDLTGRGLINPTAQILSAAMMLAHSGLGEAASRLESAIEAVYAKGDILPVDQGGSAGTDEFADAVISELSR